MVQSHDAPVVVPSENNSASLVSKGPELTIAEKMDHQNHSRMIRRIRNSKGYEIGGNNEGGSQQLNRSGVNQAGAFFCAR